MNLRTEPVMLDHLVNEKVQQATAQGVLELSGSYPPIREIVGSEGKVLNYDFRVDDDKVLVEGSISIEFAYLAYIEDDINLCTGQLSAMQFLLAGDCHWRCSARYDCGFRNCSNRSKT